MAKVTEQTNTAVVLEMMEVQNALRGKRVSITGHLGRKRDDIVKIIEMAGGTFEKEPRWGTTYLVTNADFNAGSTVLPGKSKKLLKARELGVKIISEAEFYDLIMAYSEPVES